MRTFDRGRIMLTAALLATVAALGAAASPAGAHDGHEHVVVSDGALGGSPPMSRGRPPQAARPAARPRARRRAPRARAASYQAGIPDHQSRFTCSVVNGLANFEGFAYSAGLMPWIERASYGISTLSNQYVYFRLWSGRPNGTGGHYWTTGNWARSRVGTAYNWEAFIGGRWVNQSTGTHGILPFAVASYIIGSLSYVREPVNTTRRFYFEWQWNRFDANWLFTGQWVQHWDYVGDRYCAA